MINLKKAEASSGLTQPAQQTTSPGPKIVPESQVHEHLSRAHGDKKHVDTSRPFGIREDQRDGGAQYFEISAPKLPLDLLAFVKGK